MDNYDERASQIIKAWQANPGMAGDPDLQTRIAHALRKTVWDTMVKCRGVAERELDYRLYLDREAPEHRGHNAVVACKEIIAAINAGIAADKILRGDK